MEGHDSTYFYSSCHVIYQKKKITFSGIEGNKCTLKVERTSEKLLKIILSATRQAIATGGVTDFLRESIFFFFYFKIAEFTLA